MGWNSYDYYDTTVDEAAVKANADYMAKHLKAYGWEYIVVDIQWYAKRPVPCATGISIFHSLNWKWTNTPVCCRIPNVFHLLQTVPALNHLPTMYTVWG